MRYYRYRRKASQKAKAIFFKILFILAAAAIITGLAVLTGNLLLHKVEQAEEHLETSVPPSGNAAGRADPSAGSLTADNSSTLQVFASALDLTLHDNEDSLFARVHTIAQTYNTVSVRITDGSELLYVSPALSDLVRLPDTGANTEEYTRLTNLITAARAQNLRISAVMTSSLSRLDNNTAALVDSTIAAELYVLGFHEVLITDLLEPDADTDAITGARRYLQSIHDTLSGMGSFSLGVCLPYGIYLDAVNAKQVQMLSSAVDFLAMDVSSLTVADTGAMTLSEICAALAGSFEVYNLRVVLDTADPVLLAAQYNTLVRMEITNIHFLRETTAESLTEEETPEVEQLPTETEAEETIPITNPYATTAPSAGTGSSNPGSSNPPTDNYYKTEGDSWY